MHVLPYGRKFSLQLILNLLMHISAQNVGNQGLSNNCFCSMNISGISHRGNMG